MLETFEKATYYYHNYDDYVLLLPLQKVPELKAGLLFCAFFCFTADKLMFQRKTIAECILASKNHVFLHKCQCCIDLQNVFDKKYTEI